jgi:hypothetical protein
MAALVCLLAVGAYSKQNGQANQQEFEQMEKIGRELDRLTFQANRLAGQIREAKAMVGQAQ